MLGSVTLATGGLMTMSSLVISPANADPSLCGVPTGPGLQQNLNTTLGCDVVEGTSLMSGYISDTGLRPGQQVTLEDAYEGLSSHLFYYGTYTLTLGCQPGTRGPASTTYNIEENSGSYPLSAPTVTTGTASLPQVTADSNGNIVCAYTLSVESAPGGHLNSTKSDLWIVAGGSGNTATTSVKPPVASDPADSTSTTTPTTAPNDPTTVATDPGDPVVTGPTDPGSTSTTSTTAPPVHTATVLDPGNVPNGGHDPADPGVSDPGMTVPSVPARSPHSADPTNKALPSNSGTPADATFNPRGLSALAFTGSDTGQLAAIGLMLVLFGGLVLGVSRRWRSSRIG